MMVRKILVFSMVLFMFSAAALQARELTSRDVEGFLESMQELKPFFEKYGRDLGEADSMPENGLESIKDDWLSAFASDQDMVDIIRRNGFESPEKWAETSSQIIKAFVGIKMGGEQAEAFAQMKAMLAQIESDPNMTPEAKAQFKSKLEESLEQMESFYNVSDADRQVVTPYLSRLEKVMEWEE